MEKNINKVLFFILGMSLYTLRKYILNMFEGGIMNATETNNNYKYTGIISWTSPIFKDTFLIQYETIVPVADGRTKTVEKFVSDTRTLEKILHDDNALLDITNKLHDGIYMILTDAASFEEYLTKRRNNHITVPASRNETRSIIARYLIDALAAEPHKTSEELDKLKTTTKYDLYHRVLADMECKKDSVDRACAAINELFIKKFGENVFNVALYREYSRQNDYKLKHDIIPARETLI